MSAKENAPAVNEGAPNHPTADDSTPSGARSGVTQLLPAGPAPDTCRLLLSGALWGSQKAVKNAATLVHPEDLDEPHATIWAAIVTLAGRGITGAQAVMDEIIRTGDASQLVRDELTQATTAGGVPEAIPYYCAQILAGHFRRAVESHGTGLVGWSATASEDELWEHIITGGTRLRSLHARLTAARKGAGDAHE